MKTGAELIAEERLRQIRMEGWSPDHDDQYQPGVLAMAASCYLHELRARTIRGEICKTPPPGWPWAREWWKPTEDPVRQMVKAGALLAAAIDLSNRKTTHTPS